MQTTQKESTKKQNKLTSSGNQPQVLNPQVLSPHHIEKEYLLKKIESLRYSLKEQQRANEKLSADNKRSKQVIEVQHNNLRLQGQRFQSLLDSFLNNTEAARRMAQQIRCLTHGEEWKPGVQKIIQANKLPVNYN